MIRPNCAFRAIALATSALFLCAASPSVSAADARNPEISFALHKFHETPSEGPDVERTYFTAAGKRIAVGVPKGCQLSAGDGLLLLLTGTGLDGEVHVDRSPFTPDFAFTDNTPKYREAAEKSIPQGTTDFQALTPVMNPYPFNGWRNMGFTWTYAAFGKALVRTVTYINLEVGVQIVVTTISSKADAEKVDKIAKQFLGSWWVMADNFAR